MTREGRSPRRGDQGFVTVAAAGLAVVLVALATVVALLGAVAVARHRAAAAADLGALAAAGHVLEGADTACRAAEAVARAQRAVVVACRLDGPTVTVETAVRVGRLGAARARARAGPGAAGPERDPAEPPGAAVRPAGGRQTSPGTPAQSSGGGSARRNLERLLSLPRAGTSKPPGHPGAAARSTTAWSRRS